MIDHTGIAVTDFEKSRKFYDAALGPLGASLVMIVPEEYTGGVKVGGYTADTRAEVDAFYAAAMAAGGRDNGKPGIRAHYHPNYYGAFVFDPDGNNIEAVCHKPE